MYLTSVLVYLGILILVGFWQSRRVKTSDDFIVAGRTLPARVLVFTLLSTWIGSGSLFGGAGLGYRAGFPALWQSAGAWVGIAIVFFLAHRIRRIAKFTMPDVLELRYGPTARVLGTIVVTIAYTTIAAYQFRGGGRLLNLIAPIDVGTGALITAAFCIAYTALAGMLAVAYLDVGNGLMMTIGVGAAVGFLVVQAGGPVDALSALRPDQVALFGTLDPWLDAGALFLPTMLLLVGEANMYQKFFSARDEQAARRSVVGWIVGTIVVETLIIGVGAFGSLRIPGLSTGDSEAIVMRVAVDVLPAALGIALLCGGAAIIISTANSFLLTPASALMDDVYKRYINPRATDRQIVLWTRIMVVALGIVGFIALRFFSTILAMALWAYTMYGAAITPALLAGFFWKRATRQGGVASIATGMAVTLGWEIAARYTAGLYLWGVPTVYPAFAFSLLALAVVSLATPAPRESELAAVR
jgi:SSS family solute:Na+ symporter/sodium/proline symporter